jgi:zinc transport system permease protein
MIIGTIRMGWSSRCRPMRRRKARRPGKSIVMDDFLLRALLAGFGVALISGPLGCFVVWRNLTFFGDALAHSALLGVALGLILGVDVTFGVVVTAVAVALILAGGERTVFGGNITLGIITHGALALGLVLIAFVEAARFDVMAYLFGDILAVSLSDLVWIWGAGAIVLAALLRLWNDLLSVAIDEELAKVEGIGVGRARLIFTLLTALTVTVAMKIVGVVLATALLILPAAAARRIARSPEGMAVWASLIGSLSIGLGLGASMQWDTPSGPSIVVAAVLVFLATLLKPGAKTKPGAPANSRPST